MKIALRSRRSAALAAVSALAWLLSAYYTTQLLMRAFAAHTSTAMLSPWAVVATCVLFEAAKPTLFAEGMQRLAIGHKRLAIAALSIASALVLASAFASAVYMLELGRPEPVRQDTTAGARDVLRGQIAHDDEALRVLSDAYRAESEAGHATKARSLLDDSRRLERQRADRSERLERLEIAHSAQMPPISAPSFDAAVGHAFGVSTTAVRVALCIAFAALLDAIGAVALLCISGTAGAPVRNVAAAPLPHPAAPSDRLARARAALASGEAKFTYRSIANAIGCSQRAVQPIYHQLRKEQESQVIPSVVSWAPRASQQ